MHILITVFFRAPQGGLHENILSTIRMLLSSEHTVSVVCKPGPFAENLKKLGVGTIETNYSVATFSSVIDSISELHSHTPITLIHSHPFASRTVAVMASKMLGLPLVLTVHGRYLDGIPTTSGDYEKVITVSDGIGHYLIKSGLKEPEKLFTSPNTPDQSVFKPLKPGSQPIVESSKITVALVSRLDADKQFVLDVFCEAVVHGAKSKADIHWLIVGEGDRKDALREKIEKTCNHNTYEFTGWLTGTELRDAYLRADIAIVPGRCALEAMSCGIATIGLGSKGYTGLIGPDNWQQGVYSNFGGLGDMQQSYVKGSVEQDLDRLLASPSVRESYGQFGQEVVALFFDETKVGEELLSLYKLVYQSWLIKPKQRGNRSRFLELQVKSASAKRAADDQIELECLCSDPDELSFAWYVRCNNEVIQKHMYSSSPRFLVTLEADGSYSFQCYVKNQKGEKVSFYVAQCEVRNHKVIDLFTHQMTPKLQLPSPLKADTVV